MKHSSIYSVVGVVAMIFIVCALVVVPKFLPKISFKVDLNFFLKEKPRNIDFFTEREQIYKERNEVIKNACEYYRVNEPSVYSKLIGAHSFYWNGNSKYKLLWCRVAKAGTTSWKYNFGTLKRNNTKKELAWYKSVRANRSVLLDLWNSENSGFLTFMFTRHPFDRVLSGYRDKLQNRTKGGEFFLPIRFARYFRKNGISSNRMTFSDFVNYLLQQTSPNNHWLHISRLTSACSMHYDVPGRLETFNEDSTYVIKKKGLDELIAPVWLHKTKGNKTDLTPYYFSQISKAQLDGLYKKYETDFRLFGYDPSEYYKLVKP